VGESSVATKGKDYDLWFKLVQETKAHTESVVLHPAMWARYVAVRGLKWTSLKFEDASLPKIPAERGLYAFAVCPPAEDFPPSNWLFYIGEVGATGRKGRTLQARFSEYLDELTRMKRPNVAAHLTRYNGHIDFYYCPLDWQAQDIKLIESELISALWPEANRADYHVGIRAVRRAF
jgi:hypothetical protein